MRLRSWACLLSLTAVYILYNVRTLHTIVADKHPKLRSKQNEDPSGRTLESSPDELPRCHVSVKAPNPYAQSALQHLYDPEGILGMLKSFNKTRVEELWTSKGIALNTFFSNCANLQALDRLVADGLQMSRFGMDFSAVHTKYRGMYPSKSLLDNPDVQVLRQAYWENTELFKLFWDVDLRGWYSEPLVLRGFPGGKREQQLAALRRDGYLKIDRWEGVDIEALVAETSVLPTTNRNQNIQNTKPLLDPASELWQLVVGYLGAEANYDFQNVFRLGKHPTRKSYTNAPWHHDGCGRRLKAFLYLHDVDEETHPTLIAGGTHHTMWYPVSHYFAFPNDMRGHNKLNGSEVQKVHGATISKMTGRIGGGFIFDTNTLHAALVDVGDKPRNVVILHFADHNHAQVAGQMEFFRRTGGAYFCNADNPEATLSPEKAGFIHN